MYRVDTHVDAPVVKENQQAYQKGKRELFPDPQNGFELSANFLRSDAQKLLPIPERLLYLLLCDYVGKKMDGKYWCCPGVTTLAETMGVSDRSIQLWLKSLIAKGFLEREDRIRNGAHTSNSYYLKPASQIRVVNGTSPQVVNSVSPGVVNGASPKETRGNETSKEETTPQTPLPKRGARVTALERIHMMNAMWDIIGNPDRYKEQTFSRYASIMASKGFKPCDMEPYAEYIRNSWGTYEGPLKFHHLVRFSEDDWRETLDTAAGLVRGLVV